MGKKRKKKSWGCICSDLSANFRKRPAIPLFFSLFASSSSSFSIFGRDSPGQVEEEEEDDDEVVEEDEGEEDSNLSANVKRVSLFCIFLKNLLKCQSIARLT